MPRIDVKPFISHLKTALRGQGPMYEELAQAIKSAIDRGDWLPATRLPPERALAEGLNISRTTVVLAYARLRESGHVESRHGSGSWVRRAGKTNWPSPQEHDVTSAFRRNVVFRSLLERSGNRIGFVTTHLPPLPCVDEAAREVARQPLGDLSGNEGYFPLGLPELRQSIARHLTRRGLPTREDELIITSGAQQGISLIASLLVARGETVVTEDPTYIGAIDVFSAMGARLLATAGYADTLDLDRLRALLATRPRLCYLVPDFHNPTGSVLPEPARREIAQICDELQVPVVEDCSLSDLGLGTDPPPPIASFRPHAPILTIGSFSKLFWTGLRVGYLRGPEGLITRLGRFKALSDLGSSFFPQAMTIRLLSEWNAAKQTRQRELTTKLASLTSLLAEKLPTFRFKKPSGGMLLWARMEDGDAGDLAQIAARHGVTVVAGSGNSPDRRFVDYLRLPFVADPSTMIEGINRLAAAAKEYQPQISTPRSTFDVIV